MRKVAAFTLTFAALVVVVMFGAPEPPSVSGQPAQSAAAGYEYEVLPGVRSVASVRMTCGWHQVCAGTVPDGDAVDFAANTGDRVYAVFRATDANANYSPVVSLVTDDASYTECRRVIVDIVKRGSTTPIAQVQYVHAIGKGIVAEDDVLPFPMEDGGVASEQVAIVARPSWVDARQAVEAAADARFPSGLAPFEEQEINVDGVPVRVVNFGTTGDPDWHEQAVLRDDSDGKDCPTTGPHLDQRTSTHSNRDDNNDDLGIRRGKSGRWYCVPSDLWMWVVSSRPASELEKQVTLAPVVYAPDFGWVCPTLRSLTVDLAGGPDTGEVTITPPAPAEHRVRTVDDKRTGHYADGWEVTLTATVKAGRAFMGWNGLPAGGANAAETTISMSGDREVTANIALVDNFVKPVEFLTLAVETAGADDESVGGSVKAKGRGIGLEATPDERGAYFRGELVDVTATPDDGYEFSHWTGGCAASQESDCVVTMNHDTAVTAHFRKETRTLEFSAEPEWCGDADAVLVSGVSNDVLFIPGPGSFEYRVGLGEAVRLTLEDIDATCTLSRWDGIEAAQQGDASGNSRARQERSDSLPLSRTVVMDQNRTVTAVFTWTDEAPEFAADAEPFTARFTVGVQKSVQLPEATAGNGGLSYSLSSIPAGLEFDSETAVLARKPMTTGTMAPGTTTATLTVQDEDDNSAATDADTITVKITVNDNDPPPPTDMRCRLIVTAGSGGSAGVTGSGWGCKTHSYWARANSGYCLVNWSVVPPTTGLPAARAQSRSQCYSGSYTFSITLTAQASPYVVAYRANFQDITTGGTSGVSQQSATWNWTATCFEPPDLHGSGGGLPTRSAAVAARKAWYDSVGCEAFSSSGLRIWSTPGTWRWWARCFNGSTGGQGGYATQALAQSALTTWFNTNCLSASSTARGEAGADQAAQDREGAQAGRAPAQTCTTWYYEFTFHDHSDGPSTTELTSAPHEGYGSYEGAVAASERHADSLDGNAAIEILQVSIGCRVGS